MPTAERRRAPVAGSIRAIPLLLQLVLSARRLLAVFPAAADRPARHVS